MTWSAPSERTKSILSVRQTPVTSAPIDLAIWTANGPTLPEAPSISTLVAGLGGSAVAKPEALERENRRMRQGGRVLEAHAGRHRLERPLRRADVFGERARAEREQVGEHGITRFEPARLGAGRFD